VADYMVLTAAHCVRGAVESPGTIRFEAGWGAGGPTAQRQGAAVLLASQTEAKGLIGLNEDVALVMLDAPLPPADFPPLNLADPEAGPFTLFGFDRGAPDLPRTALCRPLAKPPGLMALDCPVVSGNSGAPLLERDGEAWRVVAVMVASAQGRPVRSWAVLPPVPLRLSIQQASPTSP
jgi:protease YdgD